MEHGSACNAKNHRHHRQTCLSISVVQIVFFHFESNSYHSVSKVTSSMYLLNKFNCFYSTALLRFLLEFQYLVGDNGTTDDVMFVDFVGFARRGC